MFLKILNVGRLGVKEVKGVFFLEAILKLYARREGISTQHKTEWNSPNLPTGSAFIFFFFSKQNQAFGTSYRRLTLCNLG